MVFKTNQAFKWITYVWGDFDGETFVKRGFFRSTIPFLWASFIWIHLVCKKTRIANNRLITTSVLGGQLFSLAYSGRDPAKSSRHTEIVAQRLWSGG